MLGMLYICVTWGICIFELNAHIRMFTQLPVTLIHLIMLLPDISVTVRGPLILTFLVYKAKAIKELLHQFSPNRQYIQTSVLKHGQLSAD